MTTPPCSKPVAPLWPFRPHRPAMPISVAGRNLRCIRLQSAGRLRTRQRLRGAIRGINPATPAHIRSRQPSVGEGGRTGSSPTTADGGGEPSRWQLPDALAEADRVDLVRDAAAGVPRVAADQVAPPRASTREADVVLGRIAPRCRVHLEEVVGAGRLRQRADVERHAVEDLDMRRRVRTTAKLLI